VAAISVESKKLLNRVAEYYRHSLSAGSEGLTYLRDKLQIHHNLVIEDCRLGYSDGSLVDTLPEDPAVITRLTELGILDKKGRDRLRHCIVVPLMDASGDIVNLYARNVRLHRARYMRRNVTGLINPRAFKACDDVILTASVTDLQVIYDHGVRCCAHIHCGNHFESAGAFHHSRSLKRILVLAFNTRRPAACIKRLTDRFTHKGLAVHPLHLPGKNALSFFGEHTMKAFEQFVEDVKKEGARVSRAKVARGFERTEAGFYCIADGVRQYEIKGISRKATQHKVTIKANTFAHKILAIEEGPGMKGAAYSIRNIQSSGKITIAATGKSAGEYGLRTRDDTVKGPVAVMLTTTASTLDEETASRFIVLSIDESARMTRAIHDHHRRQEALNGVIAKSKARQLLKRIHQMVTQLAAQRGLPVAKILFTRRMIREYTGWSTWQVRTYLPPLLDYEYLILQPQSRVNRYSFAVNTGENSTGVYWAGLQLTPASELERMANTPHAHTPSEDD
jgi:hypothetical protein